MNQRLPFPKINPERSQRILDLVLASRKTLSTHYAQVVHYSHIEQGQQIARAFVSAKQMPSKFSGRVKHLSATTLSSTDASRSA
jgi:hypothetical protein